MCFLESEFGKPKRKESIDESEVESVKGKLKLLKFEKE